MHIKDKDYVRYSKIWPTIPYIFTHTHIQNIVIITQQVACGFVMFWLVKDLKKKVYDKLRKVGKAK